MALSFSDYAVRAQQRYVCFVVHLMTNYYGNICGVIFDSRLVAIVHIRITHSARLLACWLRESARAPTKGFLL